MFAFNQKDEDVCLVKDDDLFIGQTDEDLLVVKPVDCESYTEQLKREKEFLFVPSMLAGMKIVLIHLVPGFLHSMAPSDLPSKSGTISSSRERCFIAAERCFIAAL